jgi:hypothetical protein
VTQTVTDFYGALAALSVIGVTRAYGYEPNSIATADLPALWVRLPSSELGITSSYASADNDTSKGRTAELVIAVEAAGQETVSANVTAMLTMIDNMETTLDAWDATRPGFVDYSIAQQQVTIALTPYWALVATINTRG